MSWDTSEHFYQNFHSTGMITPAGGKSYVHKTQDVCATVYPSKIRVFYDRSEGLEHNDISPSMFENEHEIDTSNDPQWGDKYLIHDKVYTVQLVNYDKDRPIQMKDVYGNVQWTTLTTIADMEKIEK